MQCSIEIYQVVPSETASLSFPHMLVGRNASPHLVPSPSPSSFHPNTSEGSTSPPRKSPSLGGKIGERGEGSSKKGWRRARTNDYQSCICVSILSSMYTHVHAEPWDWEEPPGGAALVHARDVAVELTVVLVPLQAVEEKEVLEKIEFLTFFTFALRLSPLYARGTKSGTLARQSNFSSFLFFSFGWVFFFKSVRLFVFFSYFSIPGPEARRALPPPPEKGRIGKERKENLPRLLQFGNANMWLSLSIWPLPVFSLSFYAGRKRKRGWIPLPLPKAPLYLQDFRDIHKTLEGEEEEGASIPHSRFRRRRPR